MRKVFVKVEVGLVINVDEGQDIFEVLNEMDYNFTASPMHDADIEDMTIRDYEIEDSK